MKELTALHRAARLLLVTANPIDVLLRELVALLPPAMQFPELATACVRYRDERQATAGHQATPWMLAVPFETSLVVVAPDMPGYLTLAQRLLTSDANVRNVKAYFGIKRAKFDPRVVLK